MARLVLYALAALATRAYDWTTPDAGLTPFNCTAFPNPIQVLKAAGQSPPYNVSELDLATGEYTKVCPNGFPTNKEVNGFALMQYPGTGPQPSLADNVYGFVCQNRKLQRFDCDSISQVDGNLVQQGNDQGKTCNAATFVGSTYLPTVTASPTVIDLLVGVALTATPTNDAGNLAVHPRTHKTVLSLARRSERSIRDLHYAKHDFGTSPLQLRFQVGDAARAGAGINVLRCLFHVSCRHTGPRAPEIAPLRGPEPLAEPADHGLLPRLLQERALGRAAPDAVAVPVRRPLRVPRGAPRRALLRVIALRRAREAPVPALPRAEITAGDAAPATAARLRLAGPAPRPATLRHVHGRPHRRRRRRLRGLRRLLNDLRTQEVFTQQISVVGEAEHVPREQGVEH